MKVINGEALLGTAIVGLFTLVVIVVFVSVYRSENTERIRLQLMYRMTNTAPIEVNTTNQQKGWIVEP